MRGKFPLTKYQNESSFFLSHTSKPNQQKQRAANTYPFNKYDFFPIILLLTNHEELFNLNIVLSLHPPFEPIGAFYNYRYVPFYLLP